MQLHMVLTTNEQVKNSWAFACASRRARLSVWQNGQARRQSRRAVITACSRQAKALGIEVGMRYEEAKALLPEMRIIIYGK